MEYLVIESDSSMDFIKQVNNALQYGWRPQGGVMVFLNRNEKQWYYQAVVKEKAAPKPEDKKQQD